MSEGLDITVLADCWDSHPVRWVSQPVRLSKVINLGLHRRVVCVTRHQNCDVESWKVDNRVQLRQGPRTFSGINSEEARLMRISDAPPDSFLTVTSLWWCSKKNSSILKAPWNYCMQLGQFKLKTFSTGNIAQRQTRNLVTVLFQANEAKSQCM